MLDRYGTRFNARTVFIDGLGYRIDKFVIRFGPRSVTKNPIHQLPEELEKAVRDLPRERGAMGLFKRFAGPDALPPR